MDKGKGKNKDEGKNTPGSSADGGRLGHLSF
jgi:hypothetical protein